MASKFTREQENLIALFRNLPINRSKSILRQSKKIDTLIENNLKFYKIGQPRPQDTIMSHWKDIVGSQHAHRCCPKTITRNTLIITVANPVIRNELQFNQLQILQKIQSLPQCENISTITFLAG